MKLPVSVSRGEPWTSRNAETGDAVPSETAGMSPMALDNEVLQTLPNQALEQMVRRAMPKAPPVSQSGPEKVERRIPDSVPLPETAEPKIPACVKFPAKWIPMGSQRRRVSMKAAPIVNPVWSIMPMTPAIVASLFSK